MFDIYVSKRLAVSSDGKLLGIKKSAGLVDVRLWSVIQLPPTFHLSQKNLQQSETVEDQTKNYNY